jgi:hypothetical protein
MLCNIVSKQGTIVPEIQVFKQYRPYRDKLPSVPGQSSVTSASSDERGIDAMELKFKLTHNSPQTRIAELKINTHN